MVDAWPEPTYEDKMRVPPPPPPPLGSSHPLALGKTGIALYPSLGPTYNFAPNCIRMKIYIYEYLS